MPDTDAGRPSGIFTPRSVLEITGKGVKNTQHPVSSSSVNDRVLIRTARLVQANRKTKNTKITAEHSSCTQNGIFEHTAGLTEAK